MTNITTSKMQELLAAYRAKKASNSILIPEEPVKTISTAKNQVIDRYGNLITLNNKQLQFVETCGRKGESGVLIGAAGTGKTTTQFAVTQELIQAGHAGVLDAAGHKYLTSGTPGIVICAYTRRAVANIKRNLPSDLQANAITIHKLLEYQPVYYEVMDENTGESKTKMQFEATRHAGNPLPSSIKYIIIEESSMLGVDLYNELVEACQHRPKFIFLGDIQQLPPVFGPAILGFKLLELPVTELTEVYRQALESPIISLAHRILSGKPLHQDEFSTINAPGKLTIHPWKKKIEATVALNTAGMFFKAAYDSGIYNVEEDMILIPFNKAFGTDELNKIIANHIARKQNRIVYQVLAGFNKYHFSVGENVLYDKEDATIIKIEPNPVYSGVMPQRESLTLDYWGHDSDRNHPTDVSDDNIDFILAQAANSDSKSEERVRQSSHIITLKMNDSDAEIKVDKASDINALLLGYCLTVHKAQGSEWRKVFFVCHQSHSTMIQRELLYTAVTRAREELYIICEPETFTKGILSQRVKGNTLEEKAVYFQGRLNNGFTLKG